MAAVRESGGGRGRCSVALSGLQAGLSPGPGFGGAMGLSSRRRTGMRARWRAGLTGAGLSGVPYIIPCRTQLQTDSWSVGAIEGRMTGPDGMRPPLSRSRSGALDPASRRPEKIHPSTIPLALRHVDRSSLAFTGWEMKKAEGERWRAVFSCPDTHPGTPLHGAHGPSRGQLRPKGMPRWKKRDTSDALPLYPHDGL